MSVRMLLGMVGSLMLLAAVNVSGQATNANANAQAKGRSGQVVVPERPTATDIGKADDKKPKIEDRKDLPNNVSERIKGFQAVARAYLAREEALKKKLQGANDSERALLRQQLDEMREQFLERAHELRKEFQERKSELADKLQDRREMFEEIRQDLLQEVKNAKANGKPRRGVD